MGLAQIDSPIKLGDMAKIIKRKPDGVEGALREMVSDSDLYTMEFNPAARLAPQQKVCSWHAAVRHGRGVAFGVLRQGVAPCDAMPFDATRTVARRSGW